MQTGPNKIINNLVIDKKVEREGERVRVKSIGVFGLKDVFISINLSKLTR